MGGKSIRAKIKKRFRTAKRQRVEEVLEKPSLARKNKSLMEIANGTTVSVTKPKNWFLYPDASDAVVPGVSVKTPIDFRCEHMPMAGYAFRGNRRKYNEQETIERTAQSKEHPEIRIIAGRGFEGDTTMKE